MPKDDDVTTRLEQLSVNLSREARDLQMMVAEMREAEDGRAQTAQED